MLQLEVKQQIVRTSIALLTACMLSSTAWGQVIAVVGNNKITLKEFKKRYTEVKERTINPPKPNVFLEDLIRFEIGVQEAEKKNLAKDPEVQHKLRTELYKALLEKALGAKVQKIKVSESEMRKYYRKNPEVRTSHILIEHKPGAKKKEVEAARSRAKEIYDEVRKSKRPFEELVKLYTDDTISKQTGGDIGYQSRVTLVPTYYDTAIKMKVGQVKGLVRTRYGFHILKLTGKRPYSEANKKQIRAAVFDQKRAGMFNTYFKKLKKRYKIKVNRDVLKAIK